MNHWKKIFFILTISLFSSLGFSGDYIVGEGDVLQISVYENDDLSTVARVTYEGTIAVPLLGQVVVKDFTVSGVAKKIQSLYADGYIVNPQVNVFIREHRSRKAVILGQVNDPGIYNLRERTSLLELISQAGGLTKYAGTMATIKRGNGDPEKNTIEVDFKKLVEGGETDFNIQIKDGDSVYIPKQKVFYVAGEVKKPDAYSYDENPTIIKAVTMAGGFTAKASRTGVKIIRKVGATEKVMEDVMMDEVVLPDDVIVVPESFF
jgi:polysaccharide biosynthesis/export protein